MRKTKIYGIGATDCYTRDEHGVRLKSYEAWRTILARCYDATKQRGHYAMYVGCSMHPQWHLFSAFRPWYDQHYRPGYHIDKDILIPGNKVYGPWTCCCVPARINYLVRDYTSPGALPRGVVRHRRTYRGVCRDAGWARKKSCATADAAATWYRETKAKVIRRTATDALVRREINLRVHAGLLRHAALIEFGGRYVS